MEAGSYMDFLLPVLSGTGIRVSVTGREEMEEFSVREQLALYDRRRLLEESAAFRDEEALGRLRERLHTVYAFKKLEGLYTKTTVSELKIAAMADRDEEACHAFEEKEVQPYIPAFKRGEEKVSGTVRGNAYHRVMELMDFEGILGEKKEKRAEALGAFLLREREEKRLSEEYFGAVDEKKLLEFLDTGLAERMANALREGKLSREQPFVLGISADRLGDNFPKEETVLIQGIIDVFFEEADGIVLLDYKTDAVHSMKELWNRYETQLDYYTEALERLTGKPVKEKLLYSFHLGEYGTPQ
jgi:ATP-dependent helicase/nuclease subunit A